MRASDDDIKRRLAIFVDELPEFAARKGWDTAFTAACAISFKALQVMKEPKEGESMPSTGERKSVESTGEGVATEHLRQSDVYRERPVDFHPFRFAASKASTADSDDYDPLEGDISITPEQNEVIQRQLLICLGNIFPNKLDEIAPNNLSAIGADYESDHRGWMANQLAEAFFEKKLEKSFHRGIGKPAAFERALNDVRLMPKEAYNPPHFVRDWDEPLRNADKLFVGDAERNHSMQARSLMILISRLNFANGDFTSVLKRMAAYARALPDEKERTAILNKLASRVAAHNAAVAERARQNAIDDDDDGDGDDSDETSSSSSGASSPSASEASD